MKILSAAQIKDADKYTIQHEPISSIDLMERASMAFVAWFKKKFGSTHRILIVCGIGNNGADGLAIARILDALAYSVEVMIVGDPKSGSPDFRTNFNRLTNSPMVQHSNLDDDWDIIIDGLFGSGLSRPISDHHIGVINKINNSASVRVSIDMPSGMFFDQPTMGNVIVRADYVISFQVPKLSFFLPENGTYIKSWNVLDIGLDQAFIESMGSNYHAIDADLIRGMLKVRPKFYHKGNAGKALLVTGSVGKMGASILCAKACLRAGIGLLEMHIPERGNIILQTAVPEAMVILDKSQDKITETIAKDYNVIGIGPGIGQHESTVNAIVGYLEKSEKPLVLDADALNILSSRSELLGLLPQNSILTPHPGEFRRLVGDWSDDYQRLNMQREFSAKNDVIIVLKNAHSSITFPDAEVYFNTTGNSGMGTAGSGDVLTGIITSFLGQGYTPREAALLSVYLHGLSGDIGKEFLGAEESLIASDVIDYFSQAISRSREIITN